MTEEKIDLKIVSTPATDLRVGEDSDYQLHLCRKADDEEKATEFHLWFVTLVRQRHSSSGTKLVDYTTGHYVIAATERMAIYQCQDHELLYVAEQCTAIKVPLYIQGWGQHTF